MLPGADVAAEPKQVFTNNQFEQGAYNIFGVRDLCVPTFVDPGTCGDGQVNAPGEACDGQDTAACTNGRDTQTCQCLPPGPVCGDGVRNQESGEDCDGLDGLCPGHCNAHCLCDPYCGDGVVNPPTEQCDGSITPCTDYANERCTEECQCTCDPLTQCPTGACGPTDNGCGGTFSAVNARRDSLASRVSVRPEVCAEEGDICSSTAAPLQCCPGLECCPAAGRAITVCEPAASCLN